MYKRMGLPAVVVAIIGLVFTAQVQGEEFSELYEWIDSTTFLPADVVDLDSEFSKLVKVPWSGSRSQEYVCRVHTPAGDIIPGRGYFYDGKIWCKYANAADNSADNTRSVAHSKEEILLVDQTMEWKWEMVAGGQAHSTYANALKGGQTADGHVLYIALDDSFGKFDPRDPVAKFGLDIVRTKSTFRLFVLIVYEKPKNPDNAADATHFVLPPFQALPTDFGFPLGMQTFMIGNGDIFATSMEQAHPATDARPSSGGGWKPIATDLNPCIHVDLGNEIPIFGVGTLGHYKDQVWVTGYVIKKSQDGQTWVTLKDKDTQTVKVFSGNDDYNTWKRHNLVNYYGQPVSTRYLRLCPTTGSSQSVPGMRFELYGNIESNNQKYKAALAQDRWTSSLTGCGCQNDPTGHYYGLACACCRADGCQCSPSRFPNQCVQCGYAGKCGIPELVTDFTYGVDIWTHKASGCACPVNSTETDCACCSTFTKNGKQGCQCGDRQPNQCVACGTEKRECGAWPSIFGTSKYCNEFCPDGVSPFAGDK